MLNKFLVVGLLISFALIAGLYFTNPQLNTYSVMVYVVFAIIFITSIAGLLFINKQLKTGNRQFVNAFMLVSAFRMLICAALILLVVLKIGSSGKIVAIFYVAQYIGLLLTETILLSKAVKNK